jgi:hypothetical protein
MRRSLAVVLAAVLLLAPLAGVAGGLSSPNTTSDDLDIVFRGSNGNIQYVDTDGNVVDTGVAANVIGGHGDIDGQGDTEIAYLDGSNNVKYTDISGTVTDTGEDAGSVGAVVDWDGDGDQDIIARDLNNNLFAVDDGGNVINPGVGFVARVGGYGDFDGQGDAEVVFVTAGGTMSYADDDGSTTQLSGSADDVGAVIDMDGDGTLGVVYIDDAASNDLKVSEPGQGTTDLGVDAFSGIGVGGAGDIDADGDPEVAYLGTGETVHYIDTNGNDVDTGQSADRDIGSVLDWDNDGSYDDAPTVSNPSPSSTTTSADPVTLSVDVADAEFPIGDTVTVDIDHNGTDIRQTTISSAQTVTADVQDVSDGSNSWSVTVTDSEGNSNSQSYSYTADYDAPTLSNPDPTGSIDTYDGDISIEVSDADFTADDVTVTATDGGGNQIGSTTVSGNGTATLSYAADSGSNSISWQATDSHGLSASASQSFNAPDQLELRNVTDQSQVIQSANATVQLYRADNKTVITRDASQGTISLGGLPASATYVVQVEADGYQTRRTLLQSVFQQQTIYLLPKTETAHVVEFAIEDRTGEFDATTELQILRPINASSTSSDETEYQVVAGDRIGSQRQVKVTLQNGVRYRIRLSSPDGSRVRTLGAFVPRSDRVVNLQIGQLRFQVATGRQTYNVSSTTITNSSGVVTDVRFSYNDPQNQTSAIDISVQTLNGTVLATDSATGTFGNYSFVQPVAASTAANNTFVVEYEITRNGNTITGQSRPGLNRYPAGVPLAPGLKQLFSVGFLLVVGGLFSAQNARVGAVITPLFAGGLWYFDWLPPETSAIAIALALGVGVLVNFAARRP